MTCISLLLWASSCSNNYYCSNNTIRVLNKREFSVPRAGTTYQYYLYDGKEAYWCRTDKNSYDSYNIGDTLPTLVIIKQ